MGYELQVFRGENPDGERTFEPLDEGVARELILAAPRAGDVGAELVLPRETLTASVALSRDREGELRSLWVSVDAHDPAPSDGGREFRQLLELLVETAERLDARLYDRQLARFLARADVDAVAAEFGTPRT